MAAVYVTNKAGLDFTAASKWGELNFITQGYVNFGDVEKLSLKINEVIMDSKPEDFLVLAGNNLLCVMVAIIWLRKHGRLNVLHWVLDEYIVVPITTSSLPILV